MKRCGNMPSNSTSVISDSTNTTGMCNSGRSSTADNMPRDTGAITTERAARADRN
jgi:hypothetical protein